MAAYVIVDIDVRDPKKYEEYKKLAPPAIAAFGGRYLARGGETAVFEGDWKPNRLVILEFESIARARAWLDSSEYAAARAFRREASISKMVAVEGI